MHDGSGSYARLCLRLCSSTVEGTNSTTKRDETNGTRDSGWTSRAVAAAINSLVLLTFLTPSHSALEFQVTVIHGDLLHIPRQTSHTPSTSPHVSCAILFGPLWRNADQSEPPHDISHNVPGQRPNFMITFPDNRARLGIVAQFFRISGRERDSWSLTDCVVGSPVCHRQIPINFTYNS